MRDRNNLYGRANACVACHLNLDEDIRRAGHPELFFELDGPAVAQPPHDRDERPSLGPRSWLTGQATALREVSWKLAEKRDDALFARWKALAWLLRKTSAGKIELPQSEDFAAMQAAADRLARIAAQAPWTPEAIAALLREYISTHPEFADAKTEKTVLRRRAEVLVPALDRLWRAFKQGAGVEASTFETALGIANQLSHEQDDFEPARFANALEQLEVALERAVNP
jgi:hypothetical protein